jgi:hypothetical protein
MLQGINWEDVEAKAIRMPYQPPLGCMNVVEPVDSNLSMQLHDDLNDRWKEKYGNVSEVSKRTLAF